MKPKKFYKATPFQPVRNLQETIDYYRDTLGFSNGWIHDMAAGISRDEMRLIFVENPDYTNKINSDKAGFEIIWFVDNVDEIYNEYKTKNLEIICDLEDQPWGIREFTFKDINGYCIRVSETIQQTNKGD
ncbi:MAG: hypothetical protein E6Q24_07745 [Chitinophagaceae bacterium]|nr:MAG: hypothetical protein E6Q24_07745 [Chitinophagaceae bacterium]